MEDFITPQEAAIRKTVALTTIYGAVKRGELPASRVLGRIALHPADVDRYNPGSYGGIERTRKRRGPLKGDVRASK